MLLKSQHRVSRRDFLSFVTLNAAKAAVAVSLPAPHIDRSVIVSGVLRTRVPLPTATRAGQGQGTMHSRL